MKFSKIFLLGLGLFFVISTLSMAAVDEDLSLPGERWLAKFNNYICNAYGPAVQRPKEHQDLHVQFTQVTTDRSLDNALLKATFREEESECRYSAILFADNAAHTIKLIQSKAYATRGDGLCENGRRMLDEQLQENEYLYFGHPHNMSIMVPMDEAREICGANATRLGVNFTVAGRIDQ